MGIVISLELKSNVLINFFVSPFFTTSELLQLPPLLVFGKQWSLNITSVFSVTLILILSASSAKSSPLKSQCTTFLTHPNNITSVLLCLLCTLNKTEVLCLLKEKERNLVVSYLHTAVVLIINVNVLTANRLLPNGNFYSLSHIFNIFC